MKRTAIDHAIRLFIALSAGIAAFIPTTVLLYFHFNALVKLFFTSVILMGTCYSIAGLHRDQKTSVLFGKSIISGAIFFVIHLAVIFLCSFVFDDLSAYSLAYLIAGGGSAIYFLKDKEKENRLTLTLTSASAFGLVHIATYFFKMYGPKVYDTFLSHLYLTVPFSLSILLIWIAIYFFEKRRSPRFQKYYGTVLSVIITGILIMPFFRNPIGLFEYRLEKRVSVKLRWHTTSLVGKPVPDIELEAIDGSPWHLQDHVKGPVILVFWHTACAPCRALMRKLKKYQEQFPDIMNITTISTDWKKEDLMQYLKKHPFDWEQGYLTRDDKWRRIYHLFPLEWAPFIYFINEDGSVRVEGARQHAIPWFYFQNMSKWQKLKVKTTLFQDHWLNSKNKYLF